VRSIPMTQLVPLAQSPALPSLAAAAGERAQTRFWEFFVSNIRNPHTCRAYGRAVTEFLYWFDRPALSAPRARGIVRFGIALSRPPSVL
jgi:hypothetical protein